MKFNVGVTAFFNLVWLFEEKYFFSKELSMKTEDHKELSSDKQVIPPIKTKAKNLNQDLINSDLIAHTG